MNFLITRLGPNQSRIAYDLLVTAVTAALAYGFDALALGGSARVLALAPLLVVAFNRAFGIYTRFRIGAGTVKAVRLTLSMVGSAALMVALSRDAAAAVTLWGMLLWGPLCLPRLFLNLNTRVRTNFISSAIHGRGPVLVVGGGGYIGTHVVEQLLAANYQVRVLDRLLYGKKPIQDFLNNPRFELVEGDATDIVKLVEAATGASAVIHLAGLVGDPACSVDEGFTRHANVITTRMVKEVALSMGIGRFIFASSCSVYGSSDKEVDESSNLNPVSLYARTKIDSERELLLCQDENFFVTILRFATVFGHSRRPRFDLVANLFTGKAMVEGKMVLMGEHQWRPFIHVRDLARAVVMVLKSDPNRTRGQVFNVGDSRLNMTLGTLATMVQETVAEVEGRAVTVLNQPDLNDRRNYMVSFRKIQRVLGFQAETMMREGVLEMVQEFKKGTYGNYQSPSYSNVEITRQALVSFHDPQQSARLYVPLGESASMIGSPAARASDGT